MNGIEQIFSPSFLYNTSYANAGLATALFIAGFGGYHYISLFLRNRAYRLTTLESSFASAVSQRITGFVFLGFIPMVLFVHIQDISLQKYGINLHNLEDSLIWIGIFAPVIILVNYFIAGKGTNLQKYPQIRLKTWSAQSLIINFSTWVIYLFAYEAFFRGLLLFSFYYTFGIKTAIIVNIILYALAHLPKGNREIIGSVPFGLVLCLITLSTESFFAAFLIHGIMAISYEFFSIKAHPEMSIKN